MILFLDTSTPVCKLTFIDGDQRFDHEWQADRQLAKHLLTWLNDRLAEHNKTFADISGIGAFQGPGSFTGLRIGLTVLNTLSDSLNVPIVAGTGDNWLDEAKQALAAGQDDHVVLPYYGSDANITTPRK